jgi:hypothetical protein
MTRQASRFGPSSFKGRGLAGRAMVIQFHPLFPRAVKELAALALEARLLTICEWRQIAEAGCVLGYGSSLSELRRQTATYVHES